jgi:hypothetical protein
VADESPAASRMRRALYVSFVLLSLADLGLTVGLSLWAGAPCEANPIADWVWRHEGLRGLVAAKLTAASVALVACCALRLERTLSFGCGALAATCLNTLFAFSLLL